MVDEVDTSMLRPGGRGDIRPAAAPAYAIWRMPTPGNPETRQLAFLAAFLAGFFFGLASPFFAGSVSPRAVLAASTDFCRAASRSTTSPEVLVAAGVFLTSPPSTFAFTRACTASA